MVGLSIVLETTNTLCDGVTTPKPHQVVYKSAVIASVAAADMASLRRGSFWSESGFLEHCFLCRRKLLPAKDIYMYKGDKAFCSVECRSRKMMMDEEESLRRENNCSSMADSPPSSSGGHRRDPRNREGGFAY